MKKINGELYVGGTFDSVGGSYTTKIAKWNGMNWESIILSGLDVPNSEGIFAIEYYNGDYYFGGMLEETVSRNIVRWDGTNNYGVGGGIIGGLAEVHSMVVYHNELYVGGYFTIADGNAGNHIMKWDGTSWSDVGGGLDYWVNDMKVYNDQLYVAGVFEHAGGIAASKIARWDGTNWYALGADVFDNNLNTLDFYHDELYVGGAFHNVGSVPANFIAKYTGQLPSGIRETENNFSFSVYPNPSENLLHISFSNLLKAEITLEIFNSLGEKIATQKLLAGSKQTTIDISQFAKGVYTCRLLSDKEFAVKKFLKE